MLSRVASACRQQTPTNVQAAARSLRLMSSDAKPIVTLDVTNDGIAIVRINDTSAKMNTLNAQLSGEFADVFAKIEGNTAIKAAVLISGKPDCFIAGADISMLAEAKDGAAVEALSRNGQNLLNRLSASRPVVAAISGACMGGGLEVALACTYRVAANTPKTSMAVPEVMLGLLPGAGGTQRLPRLVGLPNALDMMLTGKNIRAQKARKMGLVDAVVEPLGPGLREPADSTLQYLESVAVDAARGLAQGSLKVSRENSLLSLKGMQRYLTEDFSYGRDFVLNTARKTVLKKTLGNYPAPLKIIDVVGAGLSGGMQAGLEAEARGFGELSETSQSKALISLFFGQKKCQKNEFGVPAKKSQNIAVLGAGLMGAGVAQVSLQRKFDVFLKDTTSDGVGRGLKQIYGNLSTDVKKKKLTTFERDALISSHLTTSTEFDAGFRNADMVIEAVFEDLELKKRIVKQVEQITRPDCIFASNTSALPIRDIAAASSRPDKVVGMHYFSPVDKMPLLEVIKTDATSKDTLAAAVDVGLRQGKTVIVVGDGPGFFTTRILSPMLADAITLMAEGVDFHRMDKVMQKFGFPVGPATLADEVGLDVGFKIAKYLNKAFAERLDKEAAARGTAVLGDMTASNFLGRKSGNGLYKWGERVRGKKVINEGAVAILKKQGLADRSANITDEEIQLRLASLMANESVHCLQEGILSSPVDGDIGAVFGLGFPPQTGGPFRWIDTYGAAKLVARMDEFAAAHGKHFEPAQMLRDLAASGGKFHK
jgi:enoyl-CoA hydratase/long-chain 3-hydroxyacyl-CoA dehydrogenase